jgi:predicted ribosome quality control (RQC) complex YloA/Tae2 family protein
MKLFPRRHCFSAVQAPHRFATVLAPHRCVDRAFKTFTINSRDIYVGETADENDELVTRSDAHDVWFHLDDHPSPHAVLKVVSFTSYPNPTDTVALPACDGPNVRQVVDGTTQDSIAAAAFLVKHFSKLKTARAATVIYTPIANVSKTGCPRAGMVSIKGSPRRLVVRDTEEERQALLASRRKLKTLPEFGDEARTRRGR